MDDKTTKSRADGPGSGSGSTLILLVVIIVGVISLVKDSWCGKSRRDPPPISWIYTLDQGRAAALAENKPAIVFFSASWDNASHGLLETTFANPDVRGTVSDHFVPVLIDITEEDDPIIQRERNEMKMLGTPTVIILRSDFQELVRFNEFVSPSKLKTALDTVLASRLPPQ